MLGRWKLLAQGKVEADETSAPNGDGLQQLSEDGTASLVTTTTVTEQASAQASVSAVATASVSHETSFQAATSAVSRRQLLKHKLVQLPVKKWQYLRKLNPVAKRHRLLNRCHEVRHQLK